MRIISPTCVHAEPLVYISANINLLERLSQYIGDSDNANKDTFTIELLEEVFESMSRGKAAGLYNLTIEHIHFAHPIIVTSLKELFNCLFLVGIVPEGFRDGLVVPLPKNDNASQNVN